MLPVGNALTKYHMPMFTSFRGTYKTRVHGAIVYTATGILWVVPHFCGLTVKYKFVQVYFTLDDTRWCCLHAH